MADDTPAESNRIARSRLRDHSMASQPPGFTIRRDSVDLNRAVLRCRRNSFGSLPKGLAADLSSSECLNRALFEHGNICIPSPTRPRSRTVCSPRLMLERLQKPLRGFIGAFLFQLLYFAFAPAKECIRIYVEMPRHSPRIFRSIEIPGRISFDIPVKTHR